MSGTMHTIGHAPHGSWPGVKPWGVATKVGDRVRVQTGPGAEAWGLEFIRNYSPASILPDAWPAASCSDGRHGLRGPCTCSAADESA